MSIEKLPDTSPSIWAYKSIPFAQAISRGYWDGATQLKIGDLLVVGGGKVRPFCLRVIDRRGERVDVEHAKSAAGDASSFESQQYAQKIKTLQQQVLQAIRTGEDEDREIFNDHLLRTYAEWVDFLEKTR